MHDSCSTYREEERCIQVGGGKNLERPLGRPWRAWEDNIKMDLQEMEWGHGPCGSVS